MRATKIRTGLKRHARPSFEDRPVPPEWRRGQHHRMRFSCSGTALSGPVCICTISYHILRTIPSFPSFAPVSVILRMAATGNSLPRIARKKRPTRPGVAKLPWLKCRKVGSSGKSGVRGLATAGLTVVCGRQRDESEREADRDGDRGDGTRTCERRHLDTDASGTESDWIASVTGQHWPCRARSDHCVWARLGR